VKEELFTRGKDEIFSAINTPEYLVLEFHDPVACRLTAKRQSPASSKIPNLPGPAAEAVYCNQHLGGGENWRRGNGISYVLPEA
jgi:hypothetical protein